MVKEEVKVIVKVKENGSEKISFEDFWKLYAKNVDKKKCEPKWNKLNLKDQQAAMEYITRYKEAEPVKKYRRNPETFLNNRTWENEIIKVLTDKEELEKWAKS